MSANATTVFSYVAAQLPALYPAYSVYTAKRPVQGNRPPSGGWNPGWRVPAFVLSMQEPEGVDDDGDFETVSVRYAILIEIALPGAAKTAAGTSPVYDDDALIRDLRQAVRGLLYTPRITGLDVGDVTWRARPAYEFSGAGGLPVLISGQQVVYEVFEPRPA